MTTSLRGISSLGVLTLLMLLSGCNRSTKDALVGAWHEPDGESIEFLASGLVTINLPPLPAGTVRLGPSSMSGTYSIADDTHLRLDLKVFGDHTVIAQFSLSGDTLTLKMPDDKARTFSRTRGQSNDVRPSSEAQNVAQPPRPIPASETRTDPATRPSRSGPFRAPTTAPATRRAIEASAQEDPITLYRAGGNILELAKYQRTTGDIAGARQTLRALNLTDAALAEAQAQLGDVEAAKATVADMTDRDHAVPPNTYFAILRAQADADDLAGARETARLLLQPGDRQNVTLALLAVEARATKVDMPAVNALFSQLMETGSSRVNRNCNWNACAHAIFAEGRAKAGDYDGAKANFDKAGEWATQIVPRELLDQMSVANLRGDAYHTIIVCATRAGYFAEAKKAARAGDMPVDDVFFVSQQIEHGDLDGATASAAAAPEHIRPKCQALVARARAAAGGVEDAKKLLQIAEGTAATNRYDLMFRAEVEAYPFPAIAAAKARLGDLPGARSVLVARTDDLDSYSAVAEAAAEAGLINEVLKWSGKLDNPGKRAAISLGAARGVAKLKTTTKPAEGAGSAEVSGRRALESAVRRLPQNPNALNLLAYFLLTSEDKSNQDPAAALTYARRAAELSDYNDPHILDTLALATLRGGDGPEAAKLELRALRLLPPNDASRRSFESRVREFGGSLTDSSATQPSSTPAPPAAVIPAQRAKPDAGDALRSGFAEFERGALQVGVATSGALQIIHVDQDSAPERAGLRVGDVITAIGADRVTSYFQLIEKVRSYRPGETVQVQVSRDGHSLTKPLVLGAAPPAFGVRDGAALFGAKATEAANQRILQIKKKHGIDVLIETYPSIPAVLMPQYHADQKDRFISGWASGNVGMNGVKGIYVLICKDPRAIQVTSGPKPLPAFTPNNQTRLQTGLAARLRAGEFDPGLAELVESVQSAVETNPNTTAHVW